MNAVLDKLPFDFYHVDPSTFILVSIIASISIAIIILAYRRSMTVGNEDFVLTRPKVFEVTDFGGVDGVPYTYLETERSGRDAYIAVTSLPNSQYKSTEENLCVLVFKQVNINSFQTLLRRSGQGLHIEPSSYESLERRDGQSRMVIKLEVDKEVELSENGKRLKYPMIIYSTNKQTNVCRISLIHSGDNLLQRPYIIAEFMLKDIQLWRLQTVYSESPGAACSVCLDQSASIVMLPCRHKRSCPSCTARMSACPICRVDINCYFNIQSVPQSRH